MGFDFYWKKDRSGEPRVTRRTAPKRLQGACRRIREWIELNRHLPVVEFFKRLNARLHGNYNYYGVRGNSHALYRFFKWAMAWAFNWLNRRSWRRSYIWVQFQRVLGYVSIAQPCITEPKGLRVFA